MSSMSLVLVFLSGAVLLSTSTVLVNAEAPEAIQFKTHFSGPQNVVTDSNEYTLHPRGLLSFFGFGGSSLFGGGGWNMGGVTHSGDTHINIGHISFQYDEKDFVLHSLNANEGGGHHTQYQDLPREETHRGPEREDRRGLVPEDTRWCKMVRERQNPERTAHDLSRDQTVQQRLGQNHRTDRGRSRETADRKASEFETGVGKGNQSTIFLVVVTFADDYQFCKRRSKPSVTIISNTLDILWL
nr:PREDICTED: uncharacterized protein LOC109036073 [Bemisia tabaci]